MTTDVPAVSQAYFYDGGKQSPYKELGLHFAYFNLKYERPELTPEVFVDAFPELTQEERKTFLDYVKNFELKENPK